MKDWKRGEVEPIPGKTMPSVTVVERDYPNLYARFTSLGPLMDKLGNGGKGIAWNTAHEVEFLRSAERRRARGRPPRAWRSIETAIDACEVILSLAPETNGEVAVKAWEVARQASPGATTRISPCRRKMRRSASATSSRSRARSSRRRPGRASKARRSATTPATPTCTSSSPGAR